MEFATLAIDQAEGAILAHAVALPDGRLKKGHRLTGDDIARLAEAEVGAVTAARLDPSDLDEDEAARRIALRLVGPGLRAGPAFTGRANLATTAAGLLRVEAERVDALNRIAEAITLATLPDWAMVREGQMVATAKIIPFAVPDALVDRAEAVLDAPAIRLVPFQAKRVRLVQTLLPGLSGKVLDKTTRITIGRIEAVGGRLVAEDRCPHETDALVGLIRALPADWDILLVVGASAITDRRDVIPAAVEAAGGEVRHLGMPVDPGNLLLLASLGDRPVLGLPGCARSPAANGFDWVLQRIAAGIAVVPADIQAMGVGGLLTEIPSRPQPRERRQPEAAPRLAALVLAAGRSSRMGERNKLLIEIDGVPMVRRTVRAVRDAGLAEVLVVTGHEAQRIEEALDGEPAVIVRNPDHPRGLSSSLKAGMEALPPEVVGVLVCLGDMPGIEARHVRHLIQAFTGEHAIIVPVHDGRRGNPVLLGRALFDELQDLEGDTGAKPLMLRYPDRVVEVTMDDAAVLLDVDTPDALERWLRTGT